VQFQVLVRLSCDGFREGIYHLDSAVDVAMRRVFSFLKCSVLNNLDGARM
jgi:hypothetical protein